MHLYFYKSENSNDRIQMKTIKLKKKTVRLEVHFFNKILLKDCWWEIKGLGITYCFISLSYD
jgi:hypothetical protein